ncbi:MAG: hypothetical protein AAF385_01570 [Pseudomonadota bacterium]
MQRMSLFLGLMALTASSFSAPLYDVTGRQYADWSQNTRQIYIAGVLAGMQIGGMEKKENGKFKFSSDTGKALANCAKKAEVIEYSAAFDDYLTKKTRKARKGAATVLFMELMVDRCLEKK